MFYRIVDNKLYDYSESKYSDECIETNIITQSELDVHPNKVVVQNGVLVLNPNYEQEEEEKERERISHLKCTKRVLVLMLQELQYNWLTTIKPLIEANPQAQLEWELCVELERSNPLLDLLGGQLGITPEQIDQLFRVANNEVPIEQLRIEDND